MSPNLLSQPHEKVVGFHVSVDEILAMNELNSTDELISKQEHCFETELPVAEVEQILKTGTE